MVHRAIPCTHLPHSITVPPSLSLTAKTNSTQLAQNFPLPMNLPPKMKLIIHASILIMILGALIQYAASSIIFISARTCWLGLERSEHYGTRKYRVKLTGGYDRLKACQTTKMEILRPASQIFAMLTDGTSCALQCQSISTGCILMVLWPASIRCIAVSLVNFSWSLMIIFKIGYLITIW